MTYRQAVIITYNFTHNSDKKSYHKTEADLKSYAEACQFLKSKSV